MDMKTLHVVWTSRNATNQIDVSSAEEAICLYEKIDEMCRCEPCMVEFFDDAGLSFSIGAGHAESVVTFQHSLDPPYYISKGKDFGDQVIEFNYGNETTEYMKKNAIPKGEALTSLKLFLVNRDLPSNLIWERL